MLGHLRRHPLLVILAAALLARLAGVCAVEVVLKRAGREFLIPGDAEGYWELAGDIARGREYSIYEPPRRVMRVPGFPLLLAAVRATVGDSLTAGNSLTAARVMVALLGTATCGAVYLLGRWCVDPATGLLAAAAAAVWPVLVGFSGVVLSETPFALFLTLSLAATARLVMLLRDPAATLSRLVSWAAAAGALVAAATLIRPTWLPAAVVLPVLIAGWCAWNRFGTPPRVAAVCVALPAAFAVVMAPWTLRNLAVTGHAIPTTLWVGPSLYDGLGPQATGASDMRFFDEDRLLDRMSEYDMDREYRRRAWAFAAEHPGRAAWLGVVKLWRYWRPDPSAEQFSSPAARLLVAGFYLPMLALAAAGAWVRRGDLWTLVLAGGPIVAFSLVHAVFIGSLRYRLPAEYPLCVLSAVGLRAVLERLARGGQTGGHLGRVGPRSADPPSSSFRSSMPLVDDGGSCCATHPTRLRAIFGRRIAASGIRFVAGDSG